MASAAAMTAAHAAEKEAMLRAPLLVVPLLAHVLLAADELVIWVTVAVVLPAHRNILLIELCKYTATARQET